MKSAVHTSRPVLLEAPGGRRRGLGFYLAFGVAVCAGLVLSLIGRSLIDHFGSVATFGLILAGPPILVLVVMGMRNSVSKFRTLWQQVTWWHWLWFVLLASNFVFRTRDIQSIQENPLDAAAIYRISLVGITAFSLMVRLALRRPLWMESLFRGIVGVMAVYALLGVASTLWSVNPPWTLYKSLEYLVDVALLAAVLETVRSAESYESFLDWNWVLCGSLVALAWLEAPIWPEEALETGYMQGILKVRLSGVYPGQGFNSLGTYGAILSIIAVCRLLPVAGRKFDRAWYLLILGLGMVTMVFSQTRSAIGGFVVGLVLLLFFTKRLRLAAILGAGSAVVLAFTSLGPVIVAFLQRGQSTEQMASLTGRLDWWGVAWDAFKLHPLTGYGAFASSLVVFPKLGVQEITPLHSDYVETLVGIGIWGPLLLLVGLAMAWWVLIKAIRRFPPTSLEYQLTAECIAVLGILSVRSAVMGVIASHPPTWYFVVIGYAEYLRRRYAQATAPVPSPVYAVGATAAR
jgi:exopolysaccharide production protein ExoQ